MEATAKRASCGARGVGAVMAKGALAPYRRIAAIRRFSGAPAVDAGALGGLEKAVPQG